MQDEDDRGQEDSGIRGKKQQVDCYKPSLEDWAVELWTIRLDLWPV